MPDLSAIRDTIFALSSAPGRAGIAVVRVSGPAAGTALDRLAGRRGRPRVATLRIIRRPATGEPIDQALTLWLPGPATQTGEDMAELHIHGSPAAVRATLAALGSIPGCRLAEAGEFARRAFESGRLDLTAAEGLADLIEAETDAQLAQALAQATGALARRYDGWRERLLEAMALAEAAIDFSDEADVGLLSLAASRERARGLMDEIAQHLDDGHRGEIVREGFRVALTGPPNAGKSSLLNALARREVAIVSPEPGTTRDIIEVRLDLDGLVVVVSDTAGLREAAGTIEREGMRRALDAARRADLVIWLTDLAAPHEPPPEIVAANGRPVLKVVNKIDVAAGGAAACGGLAISALTGEGVAALVARLAAAAASAFDRAGGAPITQARHRIGLERCREALARALANGAGEAELIAEDLREAATALGRITGRIDAEEVLDRVFARFCIGK